jgi:hypothetical protein
VSAATICGPVSTTVKTVQLSKGQTVGRSIVSGARLPIKPVNGTLSINGLQGVPRMMTVSVPRGVGIVFLMTRVSSRGAQLVKINLSSIKLIPLHAFSTKKMKIVILGITIMVLTRWSVMSVGGATVGIVGNV